MTTILYLHGFNSAGESSTAVLLRKAISEGTLIAPSYSAHRPAEAKAQLLAVIEEHEEKSEHLVLVGSSLGGFWARYFGILKGLPCLQINPAINPSVQLEKYLGSNVNFATQEGYELDASALAEYAEMEQEVLSSPRKGPAPAAILFSADPVINVPKTFAWLKQRGDSVTLAAGGSHRVDARMVPAILTTLKPFLPLALQSAVL